MYVLTMKKVWTACKRHEVMVKLVKYSLYILDFPWRNLESRTLESGIQKVGIRNPRGWNPESRGRDRRNPEVGIRNPGPSWITWGERWHQVNSLTSPLKDVISLKQLAWRHQLFNAYLDLYFPNYLSQSSCWKLLVVRRLSWHRRASDTRRFVAM